ncbi:hypothetical protein LNQ03_33300 [Klebsiella pneumoniae subsp. pneumoniae]|nr:hypothetical protein [Klebsiella pneumoniae subsp. pneumoniae]
MHYGVTPDVLTTAKALGGGFPYRGAAGDRGLRQRDDRRHPRHHLRR